MTLRAKFVAEFGEECARKIEEAAETHFLGALDPQGSSAVPLFDVLSEFATLVAGTTLDLMNPMTVRGSDSFRWAVVVALSYGCMKKPGFRVHHGIEPPWESLNAWLRTHARLREYDGDWDSISRALGIYEPYM